MGKAEWPEQFRNVKAASTVWDEAYKRINIGNTKGYNPAGKWSHWPNPFPYLRDLKVIACEETILVRLWFWGAVFGRWAFSTFIPSPVELTRKTVSGGYKCGFYFGRKFGSPLDFIWEDKSVSRALLQMEGPATSALFYMWAIGAAWEGMSAAHHALLAIERCGLANNEVLLEDGEGDFLFSPQSGSPVGYQTIQDPHSYYNGSAAIFQPKGHNVITAFGIITSAGKTVTSCDIYIYTATGSGPHTSIGSLSPGQTKSWECEWSVQNPLDQDYAVRVDIVQSGGGFTEVIVKRFIAVHDAPPQHVDPMPLYVPDPCRSRLMSPMNYLPPDPSAY